MHRSLSIVRWQDPETSALRDEVAIEAPLELRLSFVRDGRRIERPLLTTLRTPGDDEALALGWLYAEQVITRAEQVEASTEEALLPAADAPVASRLLIRLADSVTVDLERLARATVASSACGLCGRLTIGAIGRTDPIVATSEHWPEHSELAGWSDKVAAHQRAFDATGGIHAVARFSLAGELLDLAEDVGRHNALDKVIGRALRTGALPLDGEALWLSGRAGFEMLDKAARAGAPLVVSVGAPTSMAVEIAQTAGITLVGFLRNGRHNVYAHPERFAPLPANHGV
jgi:FdhD protein